MVIHALGRLLRRALHDCLVPLRHLQEFDWILLDVQLLREIATALIRNGGRLLRNGLIDDFHGYFCVPVWVACRWSSGGAAEDVELDGIDFDLLLFDAALGVACRGLWLRQRGVLLLGLQPWATRWLDCVSAHLVLVG